MPGNHGLRLLRDRPDTRRIVDDHADTLGEPDRRAAEFDRFQNVDAERDGAGARLPLGAARARRHRR
ncbi:MAG: hypothetical protein A2V84_06700 [Chloroflexi bacterium RBG_16_70_13]|nr:MAG: hypothetical protein A2V84_06700 [Chloroflexi bacterium RBG_16_70_13]